MTVGELLDKLKACPSDMLVYIGEQPMYKGETMFYQKAFKAEQSTMRRAENPDVVFDCFCITPEVLIRR